MAADKALSSRKAERPDPTRDQLAEELGGPLLALGLDLEGLQLTPAGRRRVLRVAVDKDGGVSLDDIAEATKEVSRLLDDPDAAGRVMGEQPYTLEVTSPGTDRPLTLPRHWRRNTSRLVQVTGPDGRSVTGRVLSADEHGAELEVDGTTRRISYADVASARVQVELNRPAGQASGGKD